MAARAGAGWVTAVERSRMLYRMARQALDANSDAPGAAHVRIVDCPLRCIGVEGVHCIICSPLDNNFCIGGLSL